MPTGASDPYFHNPRADVLELIPPGARRALDVGCGGGAFGAELKSLGLAEVWGIEVVPEVAEVAARRMDRVFVGDALEQMRSLPDGGFDLVTFNDVLEHLAWPGDALMEGRRLLAPGGRVVASLPNLRYWHTFKRLAFDGEFEYADAGIMDRTHLRFFTKKALPGFFLGAGLEIERLVGLHPLTSRILSAIRPFTGGRFDDCLPLQWGIVAKAVERAQPHPLREGG